MKEKILPIVILSVLITLAFFAGRQSVDTSGPVRAAIEQSTADAVLDFQRSAFDAGFLRMEPIKPGEAPKWVWKTPEEVWAERDAAKIAELTGEPKAIVQSATEKRR